MAYLALDLDYESFSYTITGPLPALRVNWTFSEPAIQ